MRAGAWLAILAVVALGSAAAGRVSSRDDGATTLVGIPTPSLPADARSHVRVDLFRPAGASSGPLLVFLQGNDPSEPDEHEAIAAGIADAFQRRRATVASITFKVGEADLPACAADLARAIADVDRRGSFTRVLFAGRGIGAWAAAMLALDARPWAGVGWQQSRIAGVIGMRGTYDLSYAGLENHPDRGSYIAGARDANDASPIRFVRPDAPPFLLLSAGNDAAIWARQDRAFAQKLAAGGVKVERHIVPYRDHHSLTHWSGEANDLGEIVFAFVESGLKTLEPDAGVLEMQQRWANKPPLDHDELRKSGPIDTQPIDDQLTATVNILFDRFKYVLGALPGKTYDAIDLEPWLAAHAKDFGSGDHLVITNERGEQTHLTRKEIAEHRPVIVVGIDDETNLYRLFGYYRLRQAYSWKKGQEPMPLMIRPLGAFLHFPKALPEALVNKTNAPFGLTMKSFKWSATDPLAPIKELPTTVQPTLLGPQGCVRCHSFRGAGARSHHLLATNGAPYGAFALPLEGYPPGVLKKFLFEQDAVARSFDVAPLYVDKPVAEELYALVTKR